MPVRVQQSRRAVPRVDTVFYLCQRADAQQTPTRLSAHAGPRTPPPCSRSSPAAAMLDRLLHRSVVFTISGDSYRNAPTKPENSDRKEAATRLTNTPGVGNFGDRQQKAGVSPQFPGNPSAVQVPSTISEFR